MGHREELLAGAKRCLYEKGYARTTARDIVAASGTNLGSIGYHYGSTEALLNAAMLAVIEEWGQELERSLARTETAGTEPAGTEPAGTEPADQPHQWLGRYWGRVIDSFTSHRHMWVVSIEAFLQSDHTPQLRAQLATGQQEGRRGLAALLTGTPEEQVDQATARSLGSVQLALLSGLMLQWLTDPDHAPSTDDVLAGVRALADLIHPLENE